jgi:hypothetical protein
VTSEGVLAATLLITIATFSCSGGRAKQNLDKNYKNMELEKLPGGAVAGIDVVEYKED